MSCLSHPRLILYGEEGNKLSGGEKEKDRKNIAKFRVKVTQVNQRY